MKTAVYVQKTTIQVIIVFGCVLTVIIVLNYQQVNWMRILVHPYVSITRVINLQRGDKNMSKQILAVMLAMALSSSAVGVNARGEETVLSGLNNRIVETVLENDESGGTVEASDVAIEHIFYGSFSKTGAKEVLVVCRILNTPHTGGLGRRAIIILAVDSLDIVAYNEIPADEVWVDTLPMSNGQDRIIFSGKSTYQGISAQDIMYFYIQSGQWTEVPIEELEIFGENQFYFLAEDVMIVTSASRLTGSSDITAILTWDQNEGKFVP